MTCCIALLRGINVGRARRVAMADLRDLFEGLGFSNVRTLLNSGNVVFEASRPENGRVSRVLEAAVAVRFGFPVPVVVLTRDELEAIVAENPSPPAGRDPSRLLVAFVKSPATLADARALLGQTWAPDALAVGSRAAYLWCATGIVESRLAKAFSRATGEGASTRNWATVLKLQATAGTVQNAA